MYALAAAVSAFLMAKSRISEHNIQSSGDGVTLVFDRVTKCLGMLARTWAFDEYVASFKLETDENILVEKAGRALST
jgi:phosphopantothenate---cysteine ligase (ATP)